MGFRVSGLDREEFAPLFGLSEAQLEERGIVRQVADRRPGFPCRVSLQDAEPGETLLLLNYEHLPVTSPYRARHAIYVRENARTAEPGETLLLLNYEHLPVTSPYRARHAIYVRENARTAKPAINEIPQVLRTRLLSLRAYDHSGMMVEADVVHGSDVEPVIERILSEENVDFIHVHNAKPGCFAARIDRA